MLAIVASAARGCGGHPLAGPELDAAVDGVQRYLEASGFPKMTRGEVVQFLDDLSRAPRPAQSSAAVVASPTSPRPDVARPKTRTTAAPPDDVADAESPLNYGYPLSMKSNDKESSTATPMIFVTVQPTAGPKGPAAAAVIADGRNARKMKGGSTIPASDPNAYAAFKRIPEPKNYSGIGDEMRTFLDGFGLLRSRDARAGPAPESQRRNDVLRDEADERRLLDAVLVETGAVDANGTAAAGTSSISKSDHVFNPRDAAHVKTVDVNRIAKIVENIRLLADDNGTASLPREVVQEKLENITAAIGAIDRPADAAADGRRPPADGFDGNFEVFFDDSGTKETDSDLLADSPAAGGTLTQAQNPPDPLSVDELQQLLEKHKSDVKRQQPTAAETTTAVASTEDPDAVSTTSGAAQTTARLLEATSFKGATSTEEPAAVASGEQDAASTTAAAAVESNSPSLSQLAESFGGGETASSAPAPDDLSTTAAPNRPKNGLYFYVDWNSFLTVNSGQRNQVNLRFAPKAGNPAHFIKVTVP